MRCYNCGSEDTYTIDSRFLENRNTRRRRRKCAHCDTRFTTYEVMADDLKIAIAHLRRMADLLQRRVPRDELGDDAAGILSDLRNEVE